MLKKISKMLSIIMIMILVLTPLQVSAIDKIDLDHSVSLEVTVSENAMAGMELDLYKVASISEWAEFTLTGDFAGYNVNVNGLDSEGWKNLAETLSAYADRDGLKPADTQSVTAAGTADFGALEQGLYLIDGDEFTHGETIYSPTPFMVALPNRAADSETWEYNVRTALKYEKRAVEKELISITVNKVWKDTGYEHFRPEHVTAQLLQDGKVYDEVELNTENSWRHTWTDLEADHQYQVTEKAVELYYVSVSHEGNSFVITNAIPEPGTEDGQGGDDPVDEEDEGEDPTKDESKNEDDEKLPQTGVLWWPVPVMIAAGLLLVIIGVLKRRGAESES